MIFYFGFAVVAAIAWRRRVSLPLLGLLLMAFGFWLELAQELVPTRNFRIADLPSPTVWAFWWACAGYTSTIPGWRQRHRPLTPGRSGHGAHGRDGTSACAAVQPRRS